MPSTSSARPTPAVHRATAIARADLVAARPHPAECPVGRLDLPPHGGRVQVVTPEDADAVVRPLLIGRDRERCLLLSLDVRNRLIAIDVVSIGSVDHTFMSPREVFRDALIRGAAAIVLAHNHPSGDPTASTADMAVTRRLASAGATIGISLVDHLIVGDTDFVSLARKGFV